MAGILDGCGYLRTLLFCGEGQDECFQKFSSDLADDGAWL
jgi:hypothetical protein